MKRGLLRGLLPTLCAAIATAAQGMFAPSSARLTDPACSDVNLNDTMAVTLFDQLCRNDPVNNLDPDGRFVSAEPAPSRPWTTEDTFQRNRVMVHSACGIGDQFADGLLGLTEASPASALSIFRWTGVTESLRQEKAALLAHNGIDRNDPAFQASYWMTFAAQIVAGGLSLARVAPVLATGTEGALEASIAAKRTFNPADFADDVARISAESSVRHGISDASEGIYKMAAAEDAAKSIDPTKVRFSQDSAGWFFKEKGKGTVGDLVEGLKTGSVKPGDIPPIRLVEKDGALFTLDNRRLEAFRRAGVDVPYRMATPQEIADEAWKFTTRNGGASIQLRGEL